MSALIDDFSKLPDRVERRPTLMEIAGYPHYENVCSNILAFYLDPEEPHGLGTLVLDALTRVGNIATAEESIGGNISIEREVITDKGNRVDILIESDTHAILIENKIYASVGNPLDDYADYLARRVFGGRAKHKFLLTLSQTDEGRKWGFRNLTYPRFIEQVRLMLGQYVSGADTRYLTMFLDFLNTLENLQEETRMEPEFVRFLSERSDDIEDLLAEVKRFKDELRKKVQELSHLIDVSGYQNVQQAFWRERTNLYDILIHNIQVSEGLLVSIDTDISPRGWGIYIWPRRGDISRLRELLQHLKISSEQHGNGFAHPDSFAYSENLERVASTVQVLVDKIATGSTEVVDR